MHYKLYHRQILMLVLSMTLMNMGDKRGIFDNRPHTGQVQDPG